MTDTSSHLAGAIEDRRKELGHTPTTLAAATGLSLQALKNIRRGEVRRYQERLTMPLARALGWSADSIDRLLRGEDPVVENAAPPRSPITDDERRPPEFRVGFNGELPTELTELPLIVKQLAAKDAERATEMQALRAEIERLGALVQRVLLDDDVL